MHKNVRVIFFVLAGIARVSIADCQGLKTTDAFVPLNNGQKAAYFGMRAIAPEALAKSAFMAGINQLRDSPEEWGQGIKGYGRRYGNKLAIRGVENGIGTLVAIPLNLDPRYFHSADSGLRRRSAHAVVSTFVTRTDSGRKVPAIWRFAGNYGAQFVSNAWRPERETGTGDTLIRGTVSVGNGIAANLFREFWPDIRKRVFHR